MATPFSITGVLSFSPDLGVEQVPLPFSGASSFDVKRCEEVHVIGANTQTLALVGSAPLKGLLIEVDAANPSYTINVSINGGTDLLEISSGGFIAYFSPNPSVGITEIVVATTTAARYRIWMLG
jgi:hypothetical protein